MVSSEQYCFIPLATASDEFHLLNSLCGKIAANFSLGGGAGRNKILGHRAQNVYYSTNITRYSGTDECLNRGLGGRESPSTGSNFRARSTCEQRACRGQADG